MDWKKILNNIPPDAPEPIVTKTFVEPLLYGLGFDTNEQYPEFPTGNGKDAVDFAARKNIGSDVFLASRSNPYLLVEVKGRATGAGGAINLSEGSPSYIRTRAQIKRYLLSSNCKTAQWGIITNSIHIQLFRRHGRVVFPATSNISINENNIFEIVADIKKLIENPPQALTICVYNNKGGVGKTTTTTNLAATLARLGKKVLVVDFDPQQGDLTNSLGLQMEKLGFQDCLIDRSLNVYETIQPFSIRYRSGKEVKFDVIPADRRMASYTEAELEAKIQKRSARLRDMLSSFKNEYDYIFLDCPTNWMFFSQSCVYAADAVLIPTKHNNLASLDNAAKVIKDFIQKVKAKRQDGGPIALPIFFNGEKITPPQREMANRELAAIIERERKSESSKFDLLPYFFPKAKPGNIDKAIFTLPGYAVVANAAFSRVPAALKDATAAEYYVALAKEYFLHD